MHCRQFVRGFVWLIWLWFKKHNLKFDLVGFCWLFFWKSLWTSLKFSLGRIIGQVFSNWNEIFHHFLSPVKWSEVDFVGFADSRSCLALQPTCDVRCWRWTTVAADAFSVTLSSGRPHCQRNFPRKSSLT